MIKKRRKILIVSFRYFGDALLCTSLAERIKEASETSEVSFLCYSKVAPILNNIKSIDSIITIDEGASLIKNLWKIFRYLGRFDLAVITQLSTRAVVFGRILAKRTVGFEPGKTKRNWWKKYLLSYLATENSSDQPQILKFNELLDVTGFPKSDFIRVGTPSEDLPSFAKVNRPYIVIHPTPQKNDRRIDVEKWLHLIKYFSMQGYAIAITGSGLTSEISYINEIVSSSKVKINNFAGKLSWGQTANLIKGSKFFIGIDTGTTHLAAATGVPTFAIFGPTPITGWGPWGVNQIKPYDAFEGISVQKRGNVTVLGLRPFDFCAKGCHNCWKTQTVVPCLSMVNTNSLIKLIEKVLNSKDKTLNCLPEDKNK